MVVCPDGADCSPLPDGAGCSPLGLAEGREPALDGQTEGNATARNAGQEGMYRQAHRKHHPDSTVDEVDVAAGVVVPGKAAASAEPSAASAELSAASGPQLAGGWVPLGAQTLALAHLTQAAHPQRSALV